MAYSGTIGTTVFNTDKVLRSAVRRCRLPAEQLTSEHWSIAQDQLFLFCNELSNQGVPLWAIQKQLYPLYEGQGALTMDVGVVDTLNSFFRTTSEVTGTDTDSSTIHKVEFESATEVSTVGIFWTATFLGLAFASKYSVLFAGPAEVLDDPAVCEEEDPVGGRSRARLGARELTLQPFDTALVGMQIASNNAGARINCS